MENKVNAVLVIGAGIAGIRTALDLAESGFKVYLSDRKPHSGGTLLQLDKWFPDNQCEMCKVLPTLGQQDGSSEFCLRRGLVHPNIEFVPSAKVEKVAGKAGNFSVTLKIQSTGVKSDLCIGCGVCETVCPVEVDSEFEEGLKKRKAIYNSQPLALSKVYTIDKENCTKCGICAESCPTKAIDFSMPDETKEIKVGAIILSTGFEEFDPKFASQYGHKRFPNVVTSIQLERLLSPGGPTEGNLVRLSDKEVPKSVAFIQCVGSRSLERNYCSSACCMYALKEAMLIKEKNPETEITIFYMDMRTFGKGYYRYFEKARDDYGVRFVRSRIPRIKQDFATKNLVLTFMEENGDLATNQFDLVVLSVGQTPSPQFKEVAETLGVELNEWGFCKTKIEEFSSVETNKGGIYVCGSASAPKDIADTVVEGSAAACHASILLHESRSKPQPKEREIVDEEPKSAVFVCNCGGEISKVVNTSELTKYARTLPGVVYAEEVPFLCKHETLEGLRDKISKVGANRAVLAACSSLLSGELLKEAELDSIPVEIASLREGIAWVHKNGSASATEKAKILVGMATEKVRLEETFPSFSEEVKQRALVIGGGVSGLAAALSIAEIGFGVDLVEKSEELGGNTKDIYSILEGGDPQALLQSLVKEAEESPLVNIFKETEVVKVDGFAGNFLATLSNSQQVEVGAIVVATGAQEFKPTEYLYGQSEQVLTQMELEKKIFSGELDPKQLKSVVMIQCVGSREKGRPYCSRICCSEALKNVFTLKKQNPEIEIVVLCRDVMSYGFKEQFYTEAREKGTFFVRYDLDRKPEVSLENGKIKVEAFDEALRGKLVLKPDLLALSAAIVPNDNRSLAESLEVELDEDGFFKEAEAKFRPVDFLRDGIFVCGLAHSPRGISESIAQAQAAAQRAIAILSKDRLEGKRVVSEVNERWCAGCEQCVSVCPFNARVKDPVRNVVVVREALCQGCGACVTACPNGAASLRNFKDKQILAMVDMAVSTTYD